MGLCTCAWLSVLYIAAPIRLARFLVFDFDFRFAWSGSCGRGRGDFEFVSVAILAQEAFWGAVKRTTKEIKTHFASDACAGVADER